MLLRLLPLFLIVAYSVAMWLFSAWRTKRMLAENSTLLADPRLVPLLEQLGKAMNLPPIKAHVYEIDLLNGLAAADGKIYLTRGFLNHLDTGKVTAQELASVIAHELGHVAHGHAKRRLVDFAGQNLLRTLLLGVIGRFVPLVGPYLATMLVRTISAKLSRNDEYEADAFAAALLTKSGIGTGPQISMFEKLDRLSGGNYAGTVAWLLSHPHPQKRIAAIRGLEARWAAPKDDPQA